MEEGPASIVNSPIASPRVSMTSMTGFSYRKFRRSNEDLIAKLITSVDESVSIMAKKCEIIENLEISINIVTYKVYEATHEFKVRITEYKEERNQLLTTLENKSELSLLLHDLDTRISNLEHELDFKITTYKQQKIQFQEEIENIITQLDYDIVEFRQRFEKLKKSLDVENEVLYKSQIMLINERYAPAINEFEEQLAKYEKLQLSGWRFEHSEIKLAELLEEQGLSFTPSGRLLTKDGSLLTFEEAQEKGYLKNISVSLDRIFEFFNEREKDRNRVKMQERALATPDSEIFTEISSENSKMTSEDVKYLKQYVGKPLTLALAEITTIQPKDPIHYLGHYLFKYRYNQELEEIQKKEIEELTAERKRVAEEKWKQFVEDEARNAVIEMILRAEQIAYENELKRIEQEQLLMAEEEEGDLEYEQNQLEKELLEEARDKFE